MALGEIEGVLRVVGGSGSGRAVTLQLRHAYVLLLAAWFQGFVRALHTETAVVIARGIGDPRYKALLVGCLTHERRLDRGNGRRREAGRREPRSGDHRSGDLSDLA